MLDTGVFGGGNVATTSLEMITSPYDQTSYAGMFRGCADTKISASSGQWPSSHAAWDQNNQTDASSGYRTTYNQELWYNGDYYGAQCTGYSDLNSTSTAEGARGDVSDYAALREENAGTGQPCVPAGTCSPSSYPATTPSGYHGDVVPGNSVRSPSSTYSEYTSAGLNSPCPRLAETFRSQSEGWTQCSSNYATATSPGFTHPNYGYHSSCQQVNNSYTGYEPYPIIQETGGPVRTGRRKQQNRTAASRCRQKRKNQEETLVKELQELEENNFNLAKEIQRLRKESFSLGIILSRHSCQRKSPTGSTSDSSENGSWASGPTSHPVSSSVSQMAPSCGSVAPVDSVGFSSNQPSLTPSSNTLSHSSSLASYSSTTDSYNLAAGSYGSPTPSFSSTVSLSSSSPVNVSPPTSFTPLFTPPSASFTSTAPSNGAHGGSTCAASSCGSSSNQAGNDVTDLCLTNSYNICDDVFVGMESL